MTQAVRFATSDDIPQMVDLLIQDARRRHAADPILWALADDAPAQIEKAITFALTAEEQPFRQAWLVAALGDALVGVIHAMHLPVPPIYAGRHGPPGLILPDTFVANDAPEGTVEALVEAAEADLREAGARITLASFVTGEEWRSCFERRGYEPLTLYSPGRAWATQERPPGSAPRRRTTCRASSHGARRTGPSSWVSTRSGRPTPRPTRASSGGCGAA